MATSASNALQKVMGSDNNVPAPCHICAQFLNVAMDETTVARRVVTDQNLVVFGPATESQKPNPQVNLLFVERHK